MTNNAENNCCFQKHRNCCLLVDHLMFLAERTVSDWRRILTYLGVEESTIRVVEEDALLRNISNDSREIAYQGYLKWKNIDPYKASFCTLQYALGKAQRNDVSKTLREKFHMSARRSVQRHDSFRLPVPHFVGRGKEIDQIVEFCTNSSSKRKLLLLYGLPGVGKSELLQQSLNNVLHKDPMLSIIKPLFPATNGITCWGLEDIAANILEEIQPEQVYIQFRVAALHKLLASITSPTLLVLELCSLDFRKDALPMIWNFLTNLMRSDNKFLKIIVTSFKSSDILFHQSAQYLEELHLKGLGPIEAFQLIRSLNPRISHMNCQRLYERCGSHPFILRKLSAHIKNFVSNEKELESFLKALDSNMKLELLQPMLSTSTMKYNMKIVFQGLEAKEQKTLVMLCGFPDIIPIHVLNHIFDKSLYHTCNHLCSMHCIIEKSAFGQYFKINLLTTTFIKEFAETDPKLNSILIDAKEKIISYYLEFLNCLDEIFHYPNTYNKKSHCARLVSEYQEECTFCSNDCTCPTMKIVKYLFRDRKSLIMRAIQQGLNMTCLAFQTAETCLKVVHFFRHVVCCEDLLDLYDTLFVKLEEKNEKVLMAMTMASIVFIKVYTKVQEARDENIIYLTKAINHLEHNRLFVGVTETLIHCYLRRGYLNSFCKKTCTQGFSDITKANSLIQSLSNAQRKLFSLLSCGYVSALNYRNKDYRKSITERRKQIAGYRNHFGVHIYTAKALHYQGQALGKASRFHSAISCCLVSCDIYRTLKGESIDTMRVSSTLGKLYINAGKFEVGFKKLDYAKDVAEKALGDHDRVAWCYEQLARLKITNGFVAEGNELKQRADAIRQNYEMQSLAVNMKKYSLQISRDSHFMDEFNALSTGSKENEDHYVQIVFFIMLIAIIWRMFEIYYTCNCKRLF